MQRLSFNSSPFIMSSTYQYNDFHETLILQDLQNYLKRLLFLSYQPNALQQSEVIEMLSYLNNKLSNDANPIKSQAYSNHSTCFGNYNSLHQQSEVQPVPKNRLLSSTINFPDARQTEDITRQTEDSTRQSTDNSIKIEEDTSDSMARGLNTPTPSEKDITQKMSASKKIKKVISCGHPDREHYAKGMCCNCYHKKGRNKKPWHCGHDKLYAHGLCQKCYVIKYNAKKATESPAILDQLDLPFFNQFKRKDLNADQDAL